MSDRCEMSDLPPEMCSHCKGLDKKLPRVIAERVIESKYTSGCPSCGSWIGKYEPIGLVDGDWVCAGCFTLEDTL